MTASLFQPYIAKCRVCRKEHWAPSREAFARKEEACSVEAIGALANREWLNKNGVVAPVVSADAETVVKPVVIAS